MLSHPGRLALGFIVIGVILYFGFDLKPKQIEKPNKAKSENKVEVSNIEAVLNPDQKAELGTYKKLLEEATTKDAKVEVLKKISGFWYNNGFYYQAGEMATQIAEMNPSAESWGIAGTTFLSGIEDTANQNLQLQLKQKAMSAFDKAIELDPSNPQHQMNKALCLVKLPGDNPMEGILMLLDLDKKFPNYIPVQILLTQLAMKTGQWDKAYKRIKNALILEPKNKDLNCLMVELIRQSQRNESTSVFEQYCKL